MYDWTKEQEAIFEEMLHPTAKIIHIKATARQF